VKLAERPAALAVVIFDLAAVVLRLALYLAMCTDRTSLSGEPSASTHTIFTFLGCINVYFTCRELFQCYTMHQLGLAREYWTDHWNLNDLMGCVSVFVCIGLAAGPDRDGDVFRGIAAAGSVFVWMKVLGAIKVLSIKLATFVYALEMIVSDLAEFIVVMLIVVFMFAEMFFILNAQKSSMDDDASTGWVQADSKPFYSHFSSAMSVYMMILGSFDKTWYEVESSGLTDFSVTLFVLFMFIVVSDILFRGLCFFSVWLPS